MISECKAPDSLQIFRSAMKAIGTDLITSLITAGCIRIEKNINPLTTTEYIKFTDFKYDLYSLLVGPGKPKFTIHVYF